MRGDACSLPNNLLPFDAILAANLLCRLPEPIKFLSSLPDLTKTGGIVVLVSPYSWLKAWTPKSNWLGGYYPADSKTNLESIRSADSLTKIMTGYGFDLVHQEDVPLLIREHARKFQYGISHATVWKKRLESEVVDG